MVQDYMELRKEVCDYAVKMWKAGWVTGSAGNVSVRVPDEDDRYAITPTSVKYDRLTPENIVVCDGEGDAVIEVENAPSYELPIHVLVYQARSDVHAVMHTHAVYSSVLSVLRITLPPIAEELVPYLGGPVAVADYAQSGTDDLARNVVRALKEKAAVFIANHGNLCAAKNLEKVFAACALVEHTAHIYVEALKISAIKDITLHALPDEVVEMEKGMFEVMKGF